MCDYSLCGLPSRLAIEGEELVVHRFRTGSKGLAIPLELSQPAASAASHEKKTLWNKVAEVFDDSFRNVPDPKVVCVPPGALLALRSIPSEIQKEFNLGEVEHACFVQTNSNVYQYRDAVRFANGREALLQGLPEGIKVSIISLGDTSATPEADIAAHVR